MQRVTTHPQGRFLGYVDIKVGSRVFKLPIEAAPLEPGEEAAAKAGFFSQGTESLGILVDSNAPDGEQRATIARASVEAERFISRKFLN
jgi:hypothetical protein